MTINDLSIELVHRILINSQFLYVQNPRCIRFLSKIKGHCHYYCNMTGRTLVRNEGMSLKRTRKSMIIQRLSLAQDGKKEVR